ncbi:chemotaxis protein CheA [Calderihabitans maritimus]|uniref:Chemotaxis protein CheA n=1 Tax=Calderihabitans maritimus TaxID=1246530 RepID=A0A1Z5HU08_9FIRM|nr:chemotaxis protein CheA [Calderihabitans maritimus]GAW92898.1 CheA signal transduction histidine kinase [Calderihabitans maritimus]
MTSDFDVSQYLSIFLDEVEEQLQILDENILRLEQEGKGQDLLNNIFRAAHTLKGSSASMGFEKMATLTHEMENVLDKLRNGELEVTREIIDLLLECLDILRVLKDEIANGEEKGEGVPDIVERLKKADPGERAEEKTGEPGAPRKIDLNEVEENLIRTAEAKGYHVYQVTVRLAPDCQMKSVRAFLVFNNLKDAGEVIKTVPSTEEIEDEKFDDRFDLVIITRNEAERISNIIKSVSEIASVTVKPIILGNLTEAGVQPAAQEKAAGRGRQSAKEKVLKRVSQTVRVDVQRLENLMNLVGELVIERTRLEELGNGLREKIGSGDLMDTLEEVAVHIGRISMELQDEIMKARMLPIEQIFNRFPRMVRDLAQRAEKEVELVIEGRETELDRTVIEEIGDPLIHLLRNAIDHGLETPQERLKLGKPAKGLLKLNAYHQENQIVITVEDDGRGIDPREVKRRALEKGLITEERAERMTRQEIINLIFAPGFSTAREVNDISGRGVGMDIVRNHIERINGMIDIETEVGKGTKFTIKLPLTLAINRSLLVYVQDKVLAFPLVNVVEIINVNRAEIQRIHGREVVLLRGNVLPLYQLGKVLGYEKTGEKSRDELPVVVVGLGEKRMGFIVDDLIGEQEIVIKPLGNYIGQVPGIAGATILGDGRVALILDPGGLVERVGVDRIERAS